MNLAVRGALDTFGGVPRCEHIGTKRPRQRSNMRLLLSRFALVGKERSPCGSRSSATSIAAQQNR